MWLNGSNEYSKIVETDAQKCYTRKRKPNLITGFVFFISDHGKTNNILNNTEETKYFFYSFKNRHFQDRNNNTRQKLL